MSEENDGQASNPRSRRVGGRPTKNKDLLSQIKEAKKSGIKLKAQQRDEDMVYEVVDEGKYTEIVQKRLEDDWIEEDGFEDGYLEDGRDIFDECDADGGSSSKNRKSGRQVQNKKTGRNRNIGRGAPVGDDDSDDNDEVVKPKTQDIRQMFSSSANKPDKKMATIAEDDNLDSILAELEQTSCIKTPKSKTRITSSVAKRHKDSPFVKRKEESPSPKIVAADFGLGPRQIRLPVAPTLTEEKNPFAVNKAKGTTKESLLKEIVKTSSKPSMKPPSTKPMEPPISTASHQPTPNDDDDDEELAAMDLSCIDFDEAPPTPSFDSAIWTQDGIASVAEVTSQASSSSSQVISSEDTLRFYWIDAYEDQKTQSGIIYLFGKQFHSEKKVYQSCCLRIKGLQRRIYILPREKEDKTRYSLSEVYHEIRTLFDQRKINKFKSKVVTKRYCFEPFDVPDCCEYMEVCYDAHLPALPHDIHGTTFYHVFGTATSLLENFILDHKLKGPCWLEVNCAKSISPQFSWCKSDWEIEDENLIKKMSEPAPPIPPLVAMTIKITSHSKDGQNTIVCVGCLVDSNFQIDSPTSAKIYQTQFAIVTHPKDAVLPFDLNDILQKNKWGEKYKSIYDESSGERGLLGRLLAFWHQTDPDIIIGHDLCSFELDILAQRLYAHRHGMWHKMGRLRRGVMPKVSGSARIVWLERNAFVGRLICDSRVSAKELIRARAYDLCELTRVLIDNKAEAEGLIQGLNLLTDSARENTELDLKHFFHDSNGIRRLIDYTFTSAYTALRLIHVMQVMPLALQITGICGNFLNRTLVGGRAERNEYLLLHAFFEKGFIPPDKGGRAKHYAATTGTGTTSTITEGEQLSMNPTQQATTNATATAGRRKPAYAGGLVLEPRKGFYNKFILLLDFNSLYPSIMQEYNICFTTISREEIANAKTITENNEDALFLPTLPTSDVAQGVLPTEIRRLVESRRAVKQLLSKTNNATTTQKSQWEIRQKALKITANSMYGCLGFGFSRFHAQHLAALITAKGREILLKTKELVENMDFDVIYGDTDSIMVNTNTVDYDQTLKMGNKIKTEVNKLYRLLELDMDGVFKTMLLLKKKQYAALVISKAPDGTLITKKELKGVDIVRRDWCRLAVDVGEFVVDRILNCADDKEGISSLGLVDGIFQHLRSYAARMQNGEFPLEKYVITKALAKNPEDYADSKGQPHVMIALRLNKAVHSDDKAANSGKRLRAGDTVEYIVCEDNSGLPATQRGYALQEVKNSLQTSNPLKVDLDYYLAHQLHPVVYRLCAPIEGIDQANLADCLGLDPKAYTTAANRNQERDAAGMDSDDEAAEQRNFIGKYNRYENCIPLQFSCPKCSAQLPEIKESMFKDVKTSEDCNYDWQCPSCQCPLNIEEDLSKIMNQVTLMIRRLMERYSSGKMVCNNGVSTCDYQRFHLPRLLAMKNYLSESSTNSLASQFTCPRCLKGKLRPEFSASELYRQLDFIRHVFYIETPKSAKGKFCKEIYDYVNHYLNKSAFSVVKLDNLFADLILHRTKII